MPLSRVRSPAARVKYPTPRNPAPRHHDDLPPAANFIPARPHQTRSAQTDRRVAAREGLGSHPRPARATPGLAGLLALLPRGPWTGAARPGPRRDLGPGHPVVPEGAAGGQAARREQAREATGGATPCGRGWRGRLGRRGTAIPVRMGRRPVACAAGRSGIRAGVLRGDSRAPSDSGLKPPESEPSDSEIGGRGGERARASQGRRSESERRRLRPLRAPSPGPLASCRCRNRPNRAALARHWACPAGQEACWLG